MSGNQGPISPDDLGGNLSELGGDSGLLPSERGLAQGVSDPCVVPAQGASDPCVLPAVQRAGPAAPSLTGPLVLAGLIGLLIGGLFLLPAGSLLSILGLSDLMTVNGDLPNFNGDVNGDLPEPLYAQLPVCPDNGEADEPLAVNVQAMLILNEPRTLMGNPLCLEFGSGTCNTPCSPTSNDCEAGLICTPSSDGAYVCFGGEDSNGETCFGTADDVYCTCDGPDRVCRNIAGTTLTRVSYSPECPQGGTSTGGSTTGGSTTGGSTTGGTTTGGTTGGGQQSSGAACECKGVDNVCINADGSIASASYNSAQCGGSGQCGCIPGTYTLACPDGTYAENNPQCLPGGSSAQCSCVCDEKDGNGKCIKGHDSCDGQTFCLP